MKQILIIIHFLLILQNNYCQSVEKSIFNVQTGILGLWINNETKITNSIALRTELGIDAGYIGGEIHEENSGLFLVPDINIEPRWYYNIVKRTSKNKIISNNNFNFLTTTLSFHPDSFIIQKKGNEINVRNQISLTPKWGIRRNIGKSNFNYEIGFGVGYRIIFQKKYGYENKKEPNYDLHLRIGYNFKKKIMSK